MKGFVKTLAFFGFMLAVVSVVYYLYKTKCPHACREDEDCDFDYKNASEEEILKRIVPDDAKNKKSAPHARGYFNLNRIREAEGIIRE